MNCHIFPFSFPSNSLYAPFTPLNSNYGQNSQEHTANYHSLYHTRHLWNAVSPATASLTPPQDGGGTPPGHNPSTLGNNLATSGHTFWTQQREARPQQQILPQITAALATPSPLSSAGSNEESEAAPLSANTDANDLCEDDDDPGR